MAETTETTETTDVTTEKVVAKKKSDKPDIDTIDLTVWPKAVAEQIKKRREGLDFFKNLEKAKAK